MRVMVLVKASEQSERGELPTTKQLSSMGAFNDELLRAGILLAADGLSASSNGKRVRFDKDAKTVLDGPFTETKELVAGFWIWEVASVEEAVEWLKRAPFEEGDVVEIRPVMRAEDFGDNMTPKLRERDDRLRSQLDES